MMKELSILIPTFNDPCATLVRDLRRQAEKLAIRYEIIVADDGSTDSRVVEENRAVNGWTNCRYIERRENVGRACIRNFLTREAHYEWLLFIDSDMVVCREDFLQCYALTLDDEQVVIGGVEIRGGNPRNLRAIYERAAAKQHTVEHRQQHPYQDFHTANFLIHRDVMMQHPFDERFRKYGYEDVLLGKTLEQEGITLRHIDNPLSFEIFETNEDFIRKTEEGLQTLNAFRNELKGYSRLLDTEERMPLRLLTCWHRLFGAWERRRLTGHHPTLLLFKLYKAGYWATLTTTVRNQSFSQPLY